ncbi:MAG: tRNA-dihydrouridine synthase, partial [Pseudomonadota bacterium]
KCRIGVDDDDPAEVLPEFLARITAAGVRRVIVHARKAWLKGLSPKENREIPPLDYDLVADMRRLFPTIHLSINGGVGSLDEVETLLERGFDGVMVGRAAYQNPVALLGAADRRIFGASGPDRSAFDAVEAMLPYIEAHLASGGKLHQVTRHMLGLFAGQPGARAWRRVLSEGATAPKADTRLVEAALAQVQDLAA